MKPVDGEKVKETVGADRIVTKTLYHYFVSVLTRERGFFACGFFFFLKIEILVDRIYRSADKMKSGRLSDQEVFAQEFKRVWHGKSVWRANCSLPL